MKVQNGKQVLVHYTLIVDGKVVESSKDREPLRYTHGEGKIIPGLSKRLEGMEAGEEKKIEVPAEGAYGQFNPNASKEFPKSQVPPSIKPQIGTALQVKMPDGRLQPAKITDVKEESIVIDLNHPLAGKTLHFDVKIVSVE